MYIYVCVYIALKRARFGGARHGGWESERVRSGLRRGGVAEDCYLPYWTLYTLQHAATRCSTLRRGGTRSLSALRNIFCTLVFVFSFCRCSSCGWAMSRVIVTWLIHKMHNYTSSFHNQSHDCDARGGGEREEKRREDIYLMGRGLGAAAATNIAWTRSCCGHQYLFTRAPQYVVYVGGIWHVKEVGDHQLSHRQPWWRPPAPFANFCRIFSREFLISSFPPDPICSLQ